MRSTKLVLGLVLIGLGACGGVTENGAPSGDAGGGDNDGGGDCTQEVDDCGVCGGANADQDCAGVCFGTSTEDGCGVCDDDPGNDCWIGVNDTAVIPDSDNFDLGSGTLFWSLSGAATGFFYGDGFTNPAVTVANLTDQSPCPSSPPATPTGYTGFASVNQVGDASALTYTAPPSGSPILFGTPGSDCFEGVLVFQQDGRFGVIDFQEIDANNALHIEYWLAEPGVTNFINAP